MQRRDLMWLAGLAAPGLCLSLPVLAVERELRIGNQKWLLVVLKERGHAGEAPGPACWNVTWTEFPAGPQLLEALNVGSIDFGDVGEAPPIFAQAAGAPLLMSATSRRRSRSDPGAEGLTDRSVAELKGKKVASTRAATSTTCWSRRLKQTASTYGDA